LKKITPYYFVKKSVLTGEKYQNDAKKFRECCPNLHPKQEEKEKPLRAEEEKNPLSE